MITPLPTEFSALAKIRCSQLGDGAIQLAYLVGDEQWDRAALACSDHMHTLNQLAGCVSQLLAVAPSQDAPPIPEKPKDG